MSMMVSPFAFAGPASPPYPIAAGTINASTGSTVAPAYPTGVAAGRYAILHVHHFSATAGAATITTPSGWTLITSVTTGDWRACAYYRKLDGSETGSVTVTASKTTGSTGNYEGIISIWAGVNQTSPIGTSAATATGYNAVWVGNAITTTVANACVVNVYAGWQNRSSSAETGWTQYYHQNTLIGGDGWMALTYQDKATPGLVAAEARQSESGNSAWASISFDLLPA